jgi:hypothetical protein
VNVATGDIEHMVDRHHGSHSAPELKSAFVKARKEHINAIDPPHPLAGLFKRAPFLR